MSRPSVSKVLVLVMALSAVMLVSAASASAAGKPQLDSSMYSRQFSQLTFKTNVNPNGAATSFYYEYKKGSAPAQKTPEGNLGGGTSKVLASSPVSGLTPFTTYSFRVIATNSYGTATGAWNNAATMLWTKERTKLEEVGVTMPYISVGTGTISVPSLLITISCQENGHGSTGGKEGVGDYYDIELTKCSVSKLPNCKVSVLPIKLGSTFMSKESNVTFVDFAETNCGGLFDMYLPEISGFISSNLSPWAEEEIQQSFTLTDTTQFGAPNPVTITLNTTWELASHEYFWWE